jgi:hypothetical protein
MQLDAGFNVRSFGASMPADGPFSIVCCEDIGANMGVAVRGVSMRK